MPWGTGERKEETRERGNPGFTGDGSEGDRGGEAQTGPGLVILRYHVLRITVSVTCARAPACSQCVTLRSVCMCTRTSQYCSLGIPPSLSLSLSLFLPFLLFSLSFVSSLSLARPLFSPPVPSLFLFLSTRCRGRLGRLLFAWRNSRLSRARIPWRQIVCNAYLNTDTRAVHSMERVAYGGGP